MTLKSLVEPSKIFSTLLDKQNIIYEKRKLAFKMFAKAHRINLSKSYYFVGTQIWYELCCKNNANQKDNHKDINSFLLSIVWVLFHNTEILTKKIPCCFSSFGYCYRKTLISYQMCGVRDCGQRDGCSQSGYQRSGLSKRLGRHLDRLQLCHGTFVLIFLFDLKMISIRI